jgi:serine/threonine protein kinase
VNDSDVSAFFQDLSALQRMGDPAGQKLVYSCRRHDGIACALKLVELPLIMDEDTDAAYHESVARMQREVDILASIDSPYVARLVPRSGDLRLCEIAGRPCAYYLEELIDGPSVARLTAGGAVLEPEEVARLGTHVATAIAAFWAHRTVHRDVKPANIMRDDTASVFVLLDAGYALDLTGPSLTRLLGIAGTLPYLSPERLDLSQKRKLDFRSDLYSLGVVMYETLAGRHPYIAPGMSQDDQLRAIQDVVVERPDPVAPNSDSVWTVVLRLLEKQPHARYRSCEIVIEELGQMPSKGEL